MKQLLLLFIFFVSALFVNAQKVDRVMVSGKIIVVVEDLENVTIYNESSNKGAITDSLGRFKIKVALNDEIHVSAIQLKSFKTKITKQVIESKSLRIYLNEQVNNLDEVVLLQYDLTGDLKTDVANVKVTKPIAMPSLGDISNLEVPDDYHSSVDNIAVGNQNDRISYQANGMALIGLLVNSIFKTKEKKNKKRLDRKARIGPRFEIPVSKLSTTFKNEYYIKNYNIPENKVNDFIIYLEDSNFDFTLLNPDKEIELIEFLNLKSKTFLATESGKQ